MSSSEEQIRLEIVCREYHYLRATLLGNRIVVTNAHTAEDDLHEAILQVSCDSRVSDSMSREEVLALVRHRFNALRKGNGIKEQFITEYGDNKQTKAKEEADL